METTFDIACVLLLAILFAILLSRTQRRACSFHSVTDDTEKFAPTTVIRKR